MPTIGLGTFEENGPRSCEASIENALSIGYRMIDTAEAYKNESAIGNALSRSAIPRKDIFITTKVWFKSFDHARETVMESMKKLQVDYIDLVLLHWPFGNTYAAYRDLEQLYKEGAVRAIGVSNYTPDRLIDLIMFNEIVPAVNQIETNLTSQQREAHLWMEKYNVQHEGYAPFGQGLANEMFDNPVLKAIARKYGKTERQISLRFQIQMGVVVIPKTTHPDRMKENIDIFDFKLEETEMQQLMSLDKAAPLIGNSQDPKKVETAKSWLL